MKLVAATTIAISLGLLGYLIGRSAPTRPKPTKPANPSKPAENRTSPAASSRNHKPNTKAQWKHITSTQASITSGRAYAGVVQLEGAHALFGNAKDVESELRKLCSWQRLEVSNKPIKARYPVPWTTEAKADRYWALGVASSSAPPQQVPEELVQLFERG